MSVTLAMLVKDPPLDRLALLLEYVRPVVEQVVIVVDDRTSIDVAEVMAGLGAEVVPFGWCDDFSEARNAAIPYTTSDWVLVLDPDELPSAAMLAHVAEVDATNPDVGGFIYWTANFFGGVRGPELPEHWHVRLFRRGTRFYRRVHELVAVDGCAESEMRGTRRLPHAPRDACLIHSRPLDPAQEADLLYARIPLQ